MYAAQPWLAISSSKRFKWGGILLRYISYGLTLSGPTTQCHIALPTRLSNFYKWWEKAFLITHAESPFGLSSFPQGCKSGLLHYIAMTCGHLYITIYIYITMFTSSWVIRSPWNYLHHLLIITLGKGALGGQTALGMGELFLSEISPIPLLFCLHDLILDELQEL